MLFLTGFNIPCWDVTACYIPPDEMQKYEEVTLFNNFFDELYMANKEAEIDEMIPNWESDTSLHATFENNALAGNISWTINNVTDILVKRSEIGTNKWTTILHKQITSVSPEDKQAEMTLVAYDYTPTTGKYEYAIVGIENGNESNPVVANIDVKVNELVIIDPGDTNDPTVFKTGIYGTPVTDGNCSATYSTPTSIVETLYNKYPTVYTNSEINYQTINVSGSFYPEYCDSNIMFDDKLRTDYINKFMQTLTNKKTKILKNVDGRIWLVNITTPPTNSMDGFYKFRNISFDCVEVGDINSTQDLYNAGFTNVSYDFWDE